MNFSFWHLRKTIHIQSVCVCVWGVGEGGGERGGGNCQIYVIPPEKGPTVQGKDLLPLVVSSSTFKIDPFSDDN